MKKILFIVILIVAVVGIIVVLSRRSSLNNTPGAVVSPKPTIALTPEVTPYCFAKNMTAAVETDGAAGSMYLKLHLKNNANVSCQIQADNILEILVEGHPTNVTQNLTKAPENTLLVLEPQSEVYAQLKFPNGPQCTTPVSRKVKIQYQISPDDKISFTSNQQEVSIQACTAEKEVTAIDIWSWAQQPITE